MVNVKYILQNLIKNDTNLSAYNGYSIFNFDVDASELKDNNHFNPNENYFYAVDEIQDETSNDIKPLHFLNLIPNTTNENISSLGAGVYLLKFVNWAIYYYSKLNEEYNKKKRYKTNDNIQSSYETAKYMAIIIESITGKEYKLENIQSAATKRDSKEDFELKPNKFLVLCSLFARGWYDQHFFAYTYKKGSIEFAHYVECYIKKDMSKYNAKNSNIDSNLKELFTKANSKTLDYRLYGFHILVEQEEYSSEKEKFSYSISINQYGCKHTFYRYAQLHNERHTKTIY